MKSDTPIETRLAALSWSEIAARLDAAGWATTGPLLTTKECVVLRDLYAREELFRSRVVMRRHAFGEGEYRYFAYPLPPLVAALRAEVYPRLAPLANEWNARLGLDQRYPAAHDAFAALCHRRGQKRPTPLLLRYEAGGYNRLHQDLYGAVYFPLQLTVLLSRPGAEFDGGEFVLTEQKPRTQSRARVVPLQQGEAVIFAVNDRPGRGARGFHRLKMRHGVSDLRRGERLTLGVIFHDAA